MKRWGKFYGIAAAVVAGWGVIALLIGDAFAMPVVLAHLGLAVLLSAIWLVFAGSEGLAATGSALTGRRARFGYMASLNIVLVLALLGVVNYLANRHDRRLDLTESRRYSLAPASSELIAGLTKPVHLTGVLDPSGRNEEPLRDLFGLYRAANPDKVTIEFVNPRSRPQRIKELQFSANELIHIAYGESGAEAVTKVSEIDENAVTNALLKLTRSATRKVYFLEGHGELSLESSQENGLRGLKMALENEQIKVEGLLLATHAAVPDDAAAVIVAAPASELMPEESERLVNWTKQGGRLLILHDPDGATVSRKLAENFGITIGKNVVIDQVQTLFGSALGMTPIARSFGTHQITSKFGADNPVMFMVASTVKEPESKEEGAQYSVLVRSSQSSWAETDLESAFNREDPVALLGPEDTAGPVALGLAYEKSLSDENNASQEERIARVVVYGDSDFVQNKALGAFSNRDLILNTIGWLSGQEGAITVRPEPMQRKTQAISTGQFVNLLLWSFLLPEVLVLLGLSIWWRRRTLGAPAT